jgi:hypothetical protein
VSAPSGGPWWSTILNASGTVALIGTVGAGIVTARYQEAVKSRELAVTAYSQHLAAQLETTQSAYELIGRYVSASEDLIYFSDARFRGVKEQVDAITAYNGIDAEWRQQRLLKGLMVGYYYQASSEVMAAWHKLVQAVDDFNACAVEWDRTKRDIAEAAEIRDACITERAALDTALEAFTAQVETSRRYFWESIGYSAD